MARAKTLIIVESPAKATTIEKFLGRTHYKVVASMGHIRDLPKSQFGVFPEEDFAVKYINIRGKGKLINELKREAKKSKRVLLASDPDREGEAIAWHLAYVLDIDEDTPCRVTFNEITKTTVKEAVANPRTIDMNLVDAQQARRVLDRMVGYQLSPLLWKKVKKGLSAGRVQSVALRLICEREEEINNFEPEEYWSLVVTLLNEKEESFTAQLNRYQNEKIQIPNEEAMQKILKDLEQANYVVDDIKVINKRKRPPLPFTTSSLQQAASSALNFTARKTMRLAQNLYEGVDIGTGSATGLITYMRTDSTRISDTAKAEAAEYIEATYGNDYIGSGKKATPAKKDNKQTQDAHEAIRPTSVYHTPDKVKPYLDRQAFKLYELIWSRFVASQMKEAMYEQTSVKILSGGYQFGASGSKLIFEGWRKVYKQAKEEEDKLLPDLKEGDQLTFKDHEPKQHFTQPPARYNEASLVKTLEENGIGRPSTYVAIIETIVSRNYVVRDQKQFFPTEVGELVNDLLVEYFGEIVNVDFTAALENELDRIEDHELYWKDVLREFNDVFEPMLEHAEKEIGDVKIEDEVTDEVCEKCGKPMVIKMGRYGKFMACSGFPDCRNTKPLLEKIGVTCPKCHKGEVVVRRSKKGRIFYGCADYPECDFISWQKPTGEQCPVCKEGYLVEKPSKKGDFIVCSNKECHYKVEADHHE